MAKETKENKVMEEVVETTQETTIVGETEKKATVIDWAKNGVKKHGGKILAGGLVVLAYVFGVSNGKKQAGGSDEYEYVPCIEETEPEVSEE